MFGYEAKIPIFFDEIKIRTRPEHSLTPKTKLELTLSKHENILLNSLTKTREKWESLVLNRAYFWIVWRCHDICFFLFRTKCRKEQLDEDGFRHCYGFFFFESVILKVTWSQLCSKFFTTHVDSGNWKKPYSRRFFWALINTRANSFLGKHHGIKINNCAWKISVVRRS